MVAIRDIENVRKILESVPETRDRLMHFENQKTLLDVMSTFTSKMQEYEYIAAAWDKAKKRVSLSDWLSQEFILVLGNTEIAKKATDEINRVIFRRMTELILSENETSTKQTWIFLDEVRQAGRLDSLNTLLTKGRSKGACCVLGFQDIEGLRKVYGREECNELVGQCNNKAILKINSPETALWAASLFGDREVIEERKSRNYNNWSFFRGSSSKSEHTVKKNVVLALDIISFLREINIEEMRKFLSLYFSSEKIRHGIVCSQETLDSLSKADIKIL
jgi:type IV secretory pathway TraG/TraD family ATPase VirD4